MKDQMLFRASGDELVPQQVEDVIAYLTSAATRFGEEFVVSLSVDKTTRNFVHGAKSRMSLFQRVAENFEQIKKREKVDLSVEILVVKLYKYDNRKAGF